MVYKTGCGCCEHATNRTSIVREHKRALTSVNCLYNTSAVADHAIGMGNTKVVGFKQNLKERCLLERKYNYEQENGIPSEVYTSNTIASL